MRKWIVLLLLLSAGIYLLRFRTVQTNSLNVPDFEPIKDDALADRLKPNLIAPPEFDNPEALYYRASRSAGKTYLTYHYVWAGESNPSSGWKPFLNRSLYTGGLKLQRTMFGPGDIEMISLVIGPGGKVEEVEFETAEDHDPSDFGVKHKTVVLPNPAWPLTFRVMSWNHLFQMEGAQSPASIVLKPEYFKNEKWNYYEMVKEKETLLKRSRAHKPYERESVE